MAQSVLSGCRRVGMGASFGLVFLVLGGCLNDNGAAEKGSVPVAKGSVPVEAPFRMSPEVREFLGADIVRILGGANQAASFRLKTALMPAKADSGGNLISGYKVVAKGAPLQGVALKGFLDRVFDAGSYDFKSAKKCVFVPDYALRFQHGKDQVDVLLAFNCQLWRFVHNGKGRVEDFDPINASLKAMMDDLMKASAAAGSP